MSDKIHVLVADDQDLIRRGLTMMLQLEDDIQIVGQAGDGQSAIQLAQQYKPDVVLMDIKMPRVNGIQATRAITQSLPQTQVVILTTYDTNDLVFDAIRAGAQAYLLKESSEAEVLEVIRAVHRGESHIDPNIARKVMDEFRRVSVPRISAKTDDKLPMEQLTERETEILSLIANGNTNKDIAKTLYLTEGTVKNYVSKVMAKLHINDRTQLAIKALKTGMAKLDG